MFIFDVFHFDRSKKLFSACSSGVLRVRPVQAQRPTVDPAAHPSDEGSGSACRHQRSGQPYHGVAKTGSQPNLCPTDQRHREPGHQSQSCFYLRFSGFQREGEFYPPLKHFSRLKKTREVEVALLSSHVSAPALHGRYAQALFSNMLFIPGRTTFIAWVRTPSCFSPLD